MNHEKLQLCDMWVLFLLQGTSNEETENVLTILSQVHAGIAGEEDICDQDQVRRRGITFQNFIFRKLLIIYNILFYVHWRL